MVLSQWKYILDLLCRTKMLGSKPCYTPMVTSTKLTREGTPLSDPSFYRHVVGALQYLTLTRLDLSFSVNKVCQFMSSLTEDHWSVVKRILRYLKHTHSLGLSFRWSPSIALNIFTDAD